MVQKKSITMGKQNHFKLASVNKENGKIEFNCDAQVVERVKQVVAKSDSKIVFATAIGQPKSGKSHGLKQLLNYWGIPGNIDPEMQLPKDNGDFQGIRLLLSEVPRTFGNPQSVCLACLDFVCDPDSRLYNILMEVCYQFSELVIFTFSKGNPSVSMDSINLKSKKKNSQRVAACFSGYKEWTSSKMLYFEKLEDLMPSLQDQNMDDAESIKSAVMQLTEVVSNFSVQVTSDEPYKLYSNAPSNASKRGQDREKDIYSNLVKSLRDGQVKKSLRSCSDLPDILLEMAIVANGKQAAAVEQHSESKQEAFSDSVGNSSEYVAATKSNRIGNESSVRRVKETPVPPVIGSDAANLPQDSSDATKNLKERKSKAEFSKVALKELHKPEGATEYGHSSREAGRIQTKSVKGSVDSKQEDRSDSSTPPLPSRGACEQSPSNQQSANSQHSQMAPVSNHPLSEDSQTHRCSSRSSVGNRRMSKDYLAEIVATNPSSTGDSRKPLEEETSFDHIVNHDVATAPEMDPTVTGCDVKPKQKSNVSAYFPDSQKGENGKKIEKDTQLTSGPEAGRNSEQDPPGENKVPRTSSLSKDSEKNFEESFFEKSAYLDETTNVGKQSQSSWPCGAAGNRNSIARSSAENVDNDHSGNAKARLSSSPEQQTAASDHQHSSSRRSTTSPQPSTSATAKLASCKTPDIDYEREKLKLATSFKLLALKLFTRMRNEEETHQTKQSLCNTETARFLNSSTLQEHDQERKFALLESLNKCCSAFDSFQKILDSHCGTLPFVEKCVLSKLEGQLRNELDEALKEAADEKDYLKKISGDAVTAIMANISAKNEAIIQTEKQLAQSTCSFALKTYTNMMIQLIAERVFNDDEIRSHHEKTMDAILSSFSSDQRKDNQVWIRFIELLQADMEQSRQSRQGIKFQNDCSLEQLRKTTMNLYKACEREFDHSFSSKSDFTSLNDLRTHRDSALAGALQKIGPEKHTAASKEAKRMVTNYAFVKTRKLASDHPKAAAILAWKCNVIMTYNGHKQLSPLKIQVEGFDLITLDPRLWFYRGKLMILDAHLSKRFYERNKDCPWLCINDYSRRGFDLKVDQRNHEVSRAIKSCSHPEHLIAAYFKEVKNYLLNEYHLILKKITVIHDDRAGFVAKHRINSAFRLAGFPTPSFMFFTGAAAASFFDNLEMNRITLFAFVRKKKIHFVKVEKSDGHFKIFARNREENNCKRPLPDTIVDEVCSHKNVNSLVVVHDVRTDMSSLKEIEAVLNIPYQARCATAKDLCHLAFAGASAVSMSPALKYLEVPQSEITHNADGAATVLSEVDNSGESFKQIKLNFSPSFSTFSRQHYHATKIQAEKFSIEFKFTVPSTDHVTYSSQLRNDGILYEPQIFNHSTRTPVAWEMLSHGNEIQPLMPWSHPEFKTIQDPEIVSRELAEIASEPIQLQRKSMLNDVTITQETPARRNGSMNGHVSNGFSDALDSSSHQPKLNITAMREELTNLIGQFEQALQTQSVRSAVAKQARSKLAAANTLLEAEDIKPLKLDTMIKTLKAHLEIVSGSAG